MSDENEDTPRRHEYPPFWDKVVPIALTIIVVIMVVLLSVIVGVALGVLPAA
jgi:hypothetical protein